jgi:hypothetical protein
VHFSNTVFFCYVWSISSATKNVHNKKGENIMTFALFCVTMLALLSGLAITFRGYRIFLAMLPIWGFLFGFGLGAQTLQMLFGFGFLATTTSWIVGFVVGAFFAVLSYLFFVFAVAALAGSVGYGLGVGIMLWIGFNPGFLTWIIGVVAAIAVIVVTLKFNLDKYLITVETAIIGAGILIGTLLLGVGGVALASFFENPIRVMLQDSPFWAVMYLALVAGGILVQLKAPSLEVPAHYAGQA